MPITAQNQADVANLYVALFGRAPEGAGLGYWVDQVGNKGVSLATVASQMFATPAAQTFYPSFYTNDQIVTSFYLNVLGRSPDAAGQAYWVGQLNAGVSAGTVITQLIAATQAYAGTDTSALASKALFANKGTVALAFGSNVLNNSATVDAGKQILSTVTSDSATATAAVTAINATATGSSFTLTTAIDNLTGTSGNDTFTADNSSAVNAQTSVADSINGGAGTDTLRVFLKTGAGAGTLLPSMTSIENLYINNADVGVTAAGTLNTSAIAGLTSVEVDGHAVATAMTFTLKAQSFQLDNTALAAVDVIVSGAADTTQNVTLKSVAGTAASGIDLQGAALTSATITSTGGTNTIGATGTLANTVGALITTLNLAGDKLLNLTESAAMANAVTTINASTDTGGVNVDTSGGAKKAGFAFTGGSGNDTITLAAGDLSLLTSGAQLAGGTGTDTIVIKDMTPAAKDYTALNASTGFEVLSLGVTGITVDASKLTGAMATHYGITVGTEVINNVLNGTVVDLNAASASVTVAPVVGQNTMTFNVGTVATAAGFTSAAVTAGTMSTVTLNVTGSSAQTITGYTAAANGTTTITGSQALNIGTWTGGASGDSVNAAAYTGKLSLGVGSATINTVATSAGDSGKGDVISLGSAASTLVVNTVSATATGDNITLLSGHTAVDTIDFTLISTAGNTYATAAAQLAAATIIKNFNFGVAASDILKVGLAGTTVKVGVAADMAAGWTVTNGFATKSGSTVTTFLADNLSTAGTAGDTLAYTDGTNTWIVEHSVATAGKEVVIQLLGVSTATALGTAQAANTIQLA